MVTMPFAHCMSSLATYFVAFSWMLTARTTHASDIRTAWFPSGKGEFTMEGNLYLPSPAYWPAPGIVLVHGSGPQSRREEMAGQLMMGWLEPIHVFEEIALALQAQGIAVLTYDKRTCGGFNDCSVNEYPEVTPLDITSIETFVDDAVQATKYLQNHEAVKADSVVVAGHSQSGQFIPSILLDRNPSLMGGIMLAGPYSPINELLNKQNELSVELFDSLLDLTPKEALVSYPLMQDAIFLSIDVNKIANDEYNVTEGDEDNVLVGGATVSFWQSWIELADIAVQDAAKISQPLLIVNGDLDTNVPSDEARDWADYLDSVGASDRYELAILRCLTHSFNCIDVPDFSEPFSPSAIGTNVDSQLTDTLAKWIKKHAGIPLEETEGSSSTNSLQSTSGSSRSYIIPYTFLLGMLLGAAVW